MVDITSHIQYAKSCFRGLQNDGEKSIRECYNEQIS